jgi:hypothetical protein
MTRTSRRQIEALLVAAGHRVVPASQRLGVAALRPASPVTDLAVPTRRELRSMLRTAGARPVPRLRPEFVALAEPHGAMLPPAAALEPPQRLRPVRRPALVMGAAAAALTLVLVGALTGIVGGPSAEAGLQLASAVDTVVVLPDGSTVDGTRGLALPDGAVLRIGPNGRASAGDVDLGPGDEAVVEDGRLVPTSAAEAAPTTPVAPSPDAGGAAPAAVEDPAAAVVEPPAPPPSPPAPGGGAPTQAVPAAPEVPPAAPAVTTPTLPTLTLPTLPEVDLDRPSLPGVGSIP